MKRAPGTEHVRSGKDGKTYCIEHGGIEDAVIVRLGVSHAVCEDCLWDAAQWDGRLPSMILPPFCGIFDCHEKAKGYCYVCEKVMCEDHLAMPGLCNDCDLQANMNQHLEDAIERRE